MHCCVLIAPFLVLFRPTEAVFLPAELTSDDNRLHDILSALGLPVVEVGMPAVLLDAWVRLAPKSLQICTPAYLRKFARRQPATAERTTDVVTLDLETIDADAAGFVAAVMVSDTPTLKDLQGVCIVPLLGGRFGALEPCVEENLSLQLPMYVCGDAEYQLLRLTSELDTWSRETQEEPGMPRIVDRSHSVFQPLKIYLNSAVSSNEYVSSCPSTQSSMLRKPHLMCMVSVWAVIYIYVTYFLILSHNVLQVQRTVPLAG
jgi:hypothetical protein